MVNVKELEKFWKVVAPVGEYCKGVRVIKINYSETGEVRTEVVLNKVIKTFDELKSICEEWNGKANIYITIHDKDCSDDFSKNSFRSVKSVVIDIDAERSQKNYSASDDELKKAEKVALQIAEDFKEFKPLVAMTGNGYHVWFLFPPIDLYDFSSGSIPIPYEIIEQKLKAFNKFISEKYSVDGVNIDNIGDLPRIIKVVGTKSVKGLVSEERPHRDTFWVKYEDLSFEENSKLRDLILMMRYSDSEKKEVVVQLDNELKRKLDDLNEFRKIDRKLNKLLNGKWEEEYVSRSEAELALCCKLVFYGFTRKQIKQLMNKLNPIGKWNEKPESYKDLTISKAFMFTESRYIDDKLQKELDLIITDALSNKKSKQAIRSAIAKLLIDTTKFITDPLDRLWIYVPYNPTENTRYGGIYVQSGEKYISNVLENYLSSYLSSSDINEIIYIVKNKSGSYLSKDPFVDTNKFLIPVRNGILDIKTKTLLEYSPNYFFNWKIPVDYIPGAKPKKFLELLKKILPSEDDRLVLQEFFGYTLYRDNPFHKSLMLVGGGSNGKSTILTVLKSFLGSQNVVSIPLQQIEYDRFSIVHFYGKLANIFADLPPQSLKSTSYFKTLTGEDYVTASLKHKNEVISFKNYCKMIFSANKIPITEDVSDAFFRRWLVLEFPSTFLSKVDYEEKLNNIMEERDFSQEEAINYLSGSNIFLKQPNVVNEIIHSDKEMSGILNWAVEGLRRLLFVNNGFTNNLSINDMRHLYLSWASPIYRFFNDKLIKTDNYADYIPKSEVYEQFVRYLNENGIKEHITKRSLTNFLVKVFGLTEDVKKIGGKSTRVWVGIRFKDRDIEGIDIEEVEIHA